MQSDLEPCLCVTPTGSPVQSEETGLVEFRMSGPLQYMVWYHAVGLIWISQFILACQQMTVAGAVVTYYFTRSGESVVMKCYVMKCNKSNGMLMVCSLGNILYQTWVQNIFFSVKYISCT